MHLVQVRLVLVGRVSERKGTDVAVGALAELRARGVEATLAAWFLGLAVGQLVQGTLADRLGRRTPLPPAVPTSSAIGAIRAIAFNRLCACLALLAFARQRSANACNFSRCATCFSRAAACCACRSARCRSNAS